METKKNVIITGFSNPTSEGVILHLNKKTSLKTGNIQANEFWVSWDKIGELLFDEYSDKSEVEERNKLSEVNTPKANWPDDVRLKMIERSEFYGDSDKIYQYGYYDGFQHAIKKATE